MFKSNKGKFVTLFVVLFIIRFTLIIVNYNHGHNNNLHKGLTKQQEEFLKGENGGLNMMMDEEIKKRNIYAAGSTFLIRKEEFLSAVQFYKAGGDPQDVAEEKALEHLTKTKVLYNRAVKAGYSVSKEEVESRINLLKESKAKEGDLSPIQAEIDRFGSEEKYWEFMTAKSEEDLLVEKYVSFLMDTRAEELNVDKGTEEFQNQWNQEYEEFTKEIVREEKLNIIK